MSAKNGKRRGLCTFYLVSVPSFGDSFFIEGFKDVLYSDTEKVSVPSFGDSFFIRVLGKLIAVLNRPVSVPSFGDSFFMNTVS